MEKFKQKTYDATYVEIINKTNGFNNTKINLP
jgi:hypothetical protein